MTDGHTKLTQETFDRLSAELTQLTTEGRIEIANHIEDLSTRRLLPIQMIEIAASKKPAATVFIRASTTGLYTLNVEAQTPNVGEIGMYKNDLEALPSCAGVVIKNPQTRDNLATFTLVVTFKPDALKAPPPPP